MIEDNLLRRTYESYISCRESCPNIISRQGNLKTIKINGLLNSQTLVCLYNNSTEMLTEQVDRHRQEFVMIELLLQHSPALETMTITPSKHLTGTPATKLFDILFCLSSTLSSVPRSSPNARVLINHDQVNFNRVLLLCGFIVMSLIYGREM